jgi:tRNA C32,U32 (ribose-2'-O)-methylase TrmJ
VKPDWGCLKDKSLSSNLSTEKTKQNKKQPKSAKALIFGDVNWGLQNSEVVGRVGEWGAHFPAPDQL